MSIPKTGASLVPCLRYRDAPAAIDWLCQHFGFERHLVVADADAQYARAVAGGARVVIDIRDEDYGGRGFTCRDPEGHLWSFGTYDPWQ